MGTPALSHGAYSPLTSSTLPSFQTFCLERSETFSPGNSYDYAISNKAMHGSEGTNGDPISIGTAWLYAQFTVGSLSNYNYSPASRTASAGLLQMAIWGLEDELNAPADVALKNSLTTNTFYVAAQAKFGSESAAKANAGGSYGVSALNLTVPGTDTRAQDQLYRVGSPTDIGPPVPIPPTAYLLGAGLLGLVGLRRKFRK